MHFQVVWLSVLSIPTLFFKYPQIGSDTIHPELLTFGVIRWKVAWVLATQRQEELSVNNQQSFIGTYWYNCNMPFIFIEIVTLLSRYTVQYYADIEAQERERENM